MPHGCRLLVIRVSGSAWLGLGYLSCLEIVAMPSSELFNGWITQHSDYGGCSPTMLATKLDGDPTLFVGIHELPPK